MKENMQSNTTKMVMIFYIGPTPSNFVGWPQFFMNEFQRSKVSLRFRRFKLEIAARFCGGF